MPKRFELYCSYSEVMKFANLHQPDKAVNFTEERN